MNLDKKVKVAKKYKLEPSMLHELRYGTPFEEEINESPTIRKGELVVFYVASVLLAVLVVVAMILI